MNYEGGQPVKLGDRVRAVADGLSGLVVDLDPVRHVICVEFHVNRGVEYWQHPCQYQLECRSSG